MSSNDETYLEAFIESTASLPHDLRRNLDLLKVLDKSCVELVENLRHAEDAYIERAQTKILSTPLTLQEDPQSEDLSNAESKIDTDENDANENKDDDDDDDSPPPAKKQCLEKKSSTDPNAKWAVPTTEELIAYIEDVDELEKIKKYRDDAHQKVDEKVAIAQQAYDIIDGTVNRLDSDLAKLEALLKSTGQFDNLGGPKPDDLAAIQVSPNSTDWILAKVISHNTETGMYNLSDEDVESNKTFNLPDSQVVVLVSLDRLQRGDIIYAVYPDTTSFYQATVVQGPRKSGGTSFVLVNFQDDGDENGVTHDKAVPLKHCMRPPYIVNDRRI